MRFPMLIIAMSLAMYATWLITTSTSARRQLLLDEQRRDLILNGTLVIQCREEIPATATEPANETEPSDHAKRATLSVRWMIWRLRPHEALHLVALYGMHNLPPHCKLVQSPATPHQ
jgi:hypothetical protein